MRSVRLLLLVALVLAWAPRPGRAGEEGRTVRVRVQVEGASAVALERDVVPALEGALASAPGLEAIQTTVRDGSVSLTLAFEEGAQDPGTRVRARLSGLAAPGRRIELFTDPAEEAFFVAFTSEQLGPDDLSEVVRASDASLARLPGIARVLSWGATQPEVVIDLSPERLAAHGLSFAQALEALDALGARDSPGSIQDAGRLSLGAKTRLADVAELRLASAPGPMVCVLDSRPAVVRTLLVHPEAVGVTRRALAAWLRSHTSPLLARDVKATVLEPGREVRFELPEGTEPSRALDAVWRVLSGAELPARHVLGVAGDADGVLPGFATPVRLVFDTPKPGPLVRRLAAAVPGAQVLAADGLAPGWTILLASPRTDLLADALQKATGRLSQSLPEALLSPAGLGRAPAVAVHLDEGRLAAHGLEGSAVERLVRAVREGLPLPLLLFTDGREVPARLHYGGEPGATRDLGDLRIIAAGGTMVPLRAVGEVTVQARGAFPVRRQGRALVALRILPPDPPSRAALAPVLDALRKALPPDVDVELREGTDFP